MSISKPTVIRHELGATFWIGISFAGGIFTGHWFSFIAIFLLSFTGIFSD